MLDRGQDAARLGSDPTALAPETLLIFELQASHVAFAKAVAAVPGLKIYGEDDASLIGDDGGELPAHLYLTLPDQAAIEQLLRLWERWLSGKALGPDEKDAKLWSSIFVCLHDIRRWGPKDRVSIEDIALLRDEMAVNPDGQIIIEIELVFDEDDDSAAQRQIEVTDMLAVEGGELVSRCRYAEINYHALLVRLPVEAIQAIVELKADSLAGDIDVLFIRPQSDIGLRTEERDGESSVAFVSSPTKAAIAAVLDAVPIQNHSAYSQHLEFDDPEDLQTLSVGARVHGTAMTSLIVRGDLNANEPPLDRKVHVRPLLFARGGDNDDEVFREDRLIVDEFVRAVRRMKAGSGDDPPTAPEVIFINVSLGDRRKPFSGRLSRGRGRLTGCRLSTECYFW